MLDNRYQHQAWHIKLYRRRYLLVAPFAALRLWFLGRKPSDLFPLCWSDCWSIAKGTAHFKMGWYYTNEEIIEKHVDL